MCTLLYSSSVRSSSTSIWYVLAKKNLCQIRSFQLTFSCDFDFSLFPFDNQKCSIKFGHTIDQIHEVTLMSPIIRYGRFSAIGKNPIILKNLPQFEVRLKPLPSFQVEAAENIFSYTGMNITLRRISMGHLNIGYYYPTTSFALLSTISFLINPDMVIIQFCPFPDKFNSNGALFLYQNLELCHLDFS